MRANKKKKR